MKEKRNFRPIGCTRQCWVSEAFCCLLRPTCGLMSIIRVREVWNADGPTRVVRKYTAFVNLILRLLPAAVSFLAFDVQSRSQLPQNIGAAV